MSNLNRIISAEHVDSKGKRYLCQRGISIFKLLSNEGNCVADISTAHILPSEYHEQFVKLLRRKNRVFNFSNLGVFCAFSEVGNKFPVMIKPLSKLAIAFFPQYPKAINHKLLSHISNREKIAWLMNQETVSSEITVSEMVRGNLMMLDSCLPEILKYLFIDGYLSNITDSKVLIAKIEEKNPLKYRNKTRSPYKLIFYRFLIALLQDYNFYVSQTINSTRQLGLLLFKENGSILWADVYNWYSFLLKTVKKVEISVKNVALKKVTKPKKFVANTLPTNYHPSFNMNVEISITFNFEQNGDSYKRNR